MTNLSFGTDLPNSGQFGFGFQLSALPFPTPCPKAASPKGAKECYRGGFLSPHRGY